MYLLCDIDGVLIPFPSKDGNIPPSHYPDQVTPTDHDKPVTIWLNPAHGPLLDNLIADTSLDPVWCTSWRTDAATLIGLRLSLPPWPHIDLPRPPLTDSHPNGYLWKRDHVTVYINGEPCAWIDDDFTPADHHWASARTATGRPTLLIQPDPHDGLLESHVEIIRQWVSSVILPRGATRWGCHAEGPSGTGYRDWGGCPPLVDQLTKGYWLALGQRWNVSEPRVTG